MMTASTSAPQNSFFWFAKYRAKAAAKDTAVCPDGKDASWGFAMRSTMSGLTTKGLVRFTSGLIIRLQSNTSHNSANIMNTPVFLVFGIIKNKSVTAIQKIPPSPSYVITGINSSNNGLRNVCIQSKIPISN